MIVFVSLLAAAMASGQTVEGLWRTADGGGQVRLERCGQELCGTLETSDRLMAEPQLADARNPDPGLRSRPLRGLRIVTQLKGGPAAWRDGRVYDPNGGQTYRASLVLLDPDHVRLQGCVVYPICRSEVWTRIR